MQENLNTFDALGETELFFNEMIDKLLSLIIN